MTQSHEKPRILAIGKFSEDGPALLGRCCDVLRYPDANQEEFLGLVSGEQVDGILAKYTHLVDKSIISASPNLRVVSCISEGFNRVDVQEATSHGVYVTYVPGGLADVVADFTWTLLLSISRLLLPSVKYLRDRGWTSVSDHPIESYDVYDKVLGIVGLGRIGREVALRAQGFKMKVLYYDIRRASVEVESELGVEYVDLDSLLRRSDFVSVNAGLDAGSRGLFTYERLSMMKPSAYFINTARGAIVDQNALVRVLRERKIAGAALDVYENEPLQLDSPLLDFDNVLMTPHVAGSSMETNAKISLAAAGDLLAIMEGRPPKYLANPEVMKIRPLNMAKMV